MENDPLDCELVIHTSINQKCHLIDVLNLLHYTIVIMCFIAFKCSPHKIYQNAFTIAHLAKLPVITPVLQMICIQLCTLKNVPKMQTIHYCAFVYRSINGSKE